MQTTETPSRVAGATTARRPLTRLATLWAAGTGIAIVLVATTYLVAERVADPLIVDGAGRVTLGQVTGFTLFGASIGAGLAYLAGRFVRRPRLAFLVVTVSALAGYAVVPLLAAESISTAIWLNVFHVVVAIPVIGMLARYLPRERMEPAA